MPKAKKQVTLAADKQCKSSVRYMAEDADAVLQNVYLNRSFANPMPDTIVLTVEG